MTDLSSQQGDARRTRIAWMELASMMSTLSLKAVTFEVRGIAHRPLVNCAFVVSMRY